MKRALLLALVLTGCNKMGLDVVTGSGVSKTEARTVDAFTKVDCGGSLHCDVTHGDKIAVEVTADDNILPLVVTEVKNGELQAHLKDVVSATTKNTIEVKIVMPKLDGLAMNGSGQLTASDVPSSSLDVKVNGSGAVVAKGKADKLSATVNGSGSIDASAAEAANVSATINGSGNAKLNATTTLNATVNGSGSIAYTGAAKVEQAVHGSGSIHAQ
jgi:hypothetical protein